MPKSYDFEGQTFEFPDDVSDDEALAFIGKSAPKPFDITAPIRARSGNVNPQGEAYTKTAPLTLKGSYDKVMEAVHVPAQGIDEIVGSAIYDKNPTQSPDAPGGRHPGAAGRLLKKGMALSPLAIPGHLARAASAVGVPGAGFVEGALNPVEDAGAALLTDPTMALAPANAGVAALFLPQVAESLGISVGELQAELEQNGWKLTPELGEKLGKTVVGAGFAALLGHGLAEGITPRGESAAPAIKKAHADLAEPLQALEAAGMKPAESNLDLSALIPESVKGKEPTALDDLSFLPKRERVPAWEGMKQAVRSFEAQLADPTGKYDQAAFDAAMEPFLSKVDQEHRPALQEKLNEIFVSRGQGQIFLEDAAEMTAGMTPIEVVPDAKTGTQVEIYHSPAGSKQNAIFITRGPDGAITGAAKSTRGGYEYIVGGSNVMDLPGSAGPLYRVTKDAGIKSTRTTTPAGRAAQMRAAEKGLDIEGGHDLSSKGAAAAVTDAAGGAAAGLEQEPSGAAARPGGSAAGEPVREGLPGTGSASGDPAAGGALELPVGQSGSALPPTPAGFEGGSEAGALQLTKTPQPTVPLAGYDAILSAREAAAKRPTLRERLTEAFKPTNIKSLLLDENAPIYARADELAQAMGVPGKFDAETSPIPRDPRLMLPLLKNVGALARHDALILDRVQGAARGEGLLGYVTQYLDLLGGERRMSQVEAQLVQKQREAQLHGLASVIKGRTGRALGAESRLTNQLTTGQRPKMFKRAGGKMTTQERVNLAFKTLPRVRERLGSLYAGERAHGRATPAMGRALEGKFVKARKAAEGLQKQMHGKEVHPLFTSSKDVADAFSQFEDALTPEQFARVQELSAYVLDLHRRNLELANRPSARFGGSANSIITPEQYATLKKRLVGPQGTEYAPLNRILDQVEGATGWTGGAGLTSQQRAWLQEYKTGSKNAPVDPFNAALASSMRLFSDLAHNAAADSILSLGAHGARYGVDVGVRPLRGNQLPNRNEIGLSVRKKGRTIKFAAPADFGPALMAKAAPELSGLAIGTLRKARNVLREGVITLYPFFAVSNVPVDLVDTLLLSRVHSPKLNKYNPVKYLVGAAHWTAALGDTIRESPEYMEALWQGALGASFMHVTRAERGSAGMLGPKSAGGAVRSVLETVGQKTEEATKVYGYQEALRRLRTLEAAGSKYKNPKELLAAYETMKNVGTPDVLTHGSAIPEANVIFPFLNVGIQGTARMYRRFIRNPKEFLVPMLATLTATEALLLAWNTRQKDEEGKLEYDHVPQDEKDNYWSVLLPEEVFGRYAENGRLHRVKIRKPQPVRIFAGPIRDLLAGAFTASNPDYLQTALNSMTEGQPIPGLHINPSKPVSSLATSGVAALNPLMKLTLEQISNQDFLRGTPLERRAEQGRAPSERYDERTSPTAVVLSQAITKAASYIDKLRGGMLDSEGNPRELLQDVVPGPKRIEHAVRTLTGGLGQMAMGVVDPLAAELSPQAPRAREPVERIPILNDLLRRLVTLAPRDSQREKLTDGFYDRYDQLDEIVKTYPVLMRSNPDRAAAFLKERGISEYGQARGEYVAMVNASQALARLYKEARAAKTGAEAKQINDRINELLRAVVTERKRRSGIGASVAGGPSPAPPPAPALGAPADSSAAPEP